MYEGQDWSADDFYAYPKSDTLAAVISEMAAVKDDVRKKNLVRMLGNKGFLDGTGVYRLNSIGMPDPAGIMLNGTFGTASTTTYTNISEVFHLEAGQSYTILVRDTDKTVDYRQIAKGLEELGAQSLHSKKGFGVETLRYMVSNETYVGDKRLHI